MNAYAIFAVNEHLEYLIDEAARNRAANVGKPNLRARIANAVASVRVGASSAADNVSPVLPKLEDYPYRG